LSARGDGQSLKLWFVLQLANKFVTRSCIPAVKPLAAMLAAEWFLFQMSPKVIFHVAFRGECFIADVTRIRLLLRMDPHVYFQVWLFCENFIASLEGASVW